MNRVEHKIENFMVKHSLGFMPGQTVYVATSGGADSMVLLTYLYRNMKTTLNLNLIAVHVNHGIRGESADRDMMHVVNYCKDLGIECIVFNAKIDGTVIPENASEDWARQLRYDYFSSLDGIIATAHTMSDQAETILFRLARGASLKSMSGIPVKRDNYIRPLMCITREEVEELADYYNISYVTDETNLGDTYARNKIRHNVIPVLKQINSNTLQTIDRFAQRASKAQRFISEYAEKEVEKATVIQGFKFITSAFYNQDEVILEEMIVQLLSKMNCCTEQNVNLLKNNINGAKNGNYTEEDGGDRGDREFLVANIQLNRQYNIVITNKYITILLSSLITPKESRTGLNVFDYMGHNVLIEVLTVEEYKSLHLPKTELCHYADYSKLKLENCLFRSRQDGDKFKPACRAQNKVTKFTNTFPIAERDLIPLLEDEDGRIIWVYGHGFTDGYTPSDETKFVYHFIALK